MTIVRINKYLSECGVASRRKSEELILQGRVAVNGKIITELATKVAPGVDNVTVDGENVSKEIKVYFVLNKPRGYITTTDDEKNRDTVLELVKTGYSVFPVGRLDYNTTGVLLITNDGDFANFLTHPSNNIPREYEVILSKPLTLEDKQKLLKGVYIDGKKGWFTEVNIPNMNSPKRVVVKAAEGRNHFVKNMFSALGYMVKNLNRKSFANIHVDDIPQGSYKVLDEKIVKALYAKYAK